jgi:hypothetical protein
MFSEPNLVGKWSHFELSYLSVSPAVFIGRNMIKKIRELWLLANKKPEEGLSTLSNLYAQISDVLRSITLRRNSSVNVNSKKRRLKAKVGFPTILLLVKIKLS